MPLSDLFCICGLITDSRDSESGQPRKRLAVRLPHMSTTRGVDIPFATKDNPGKLKQAACAALGIGMDEVYVSEKLKRTLEGRG